MPRPRNCTELDNKSLRSQIATANKTSRDAYFRIRSVHLPQRFADFADGGVGADSVDYVRHGVDVGNVAVDARGGSLGSGLLQGIEATADFLVRAAGAQGFELCLLSAGYRFSDVVRRPTAFASR